jgi:FMN phosphatase YigB (HAD superfamily)
MTNKPILFFDFDRTLCFDRYWRSLPAPAFAFVQEYIFGADRTLLNEWMRGKYSAEEINHQLAPLIGMQFDDLWQLFVHDCETMYIDPSVLGAIHSLRTRYTTILITGNMDSFTRFTVPALSLDQYFDHINNSSVTGRLKTDEGGRVFIDHAQALNVPIAQCTLLDDSLETCQVFEKIGGRACVVSEDKPIMVRLEELGVL